MFKLILIPSTIEFIQRRHPVLKYPLYVSHLLLYLIDLPEIFGYQRNIYLHTLQSVFHLSETESKLKLLIFNVSTDIFLFDKYELHLNIKWYSSSTSV